MYIYATSLSNVFKNCISIFSNDQPCLGVDLVIGFCRIIATNSDTFKIGKSI